MNQETIKNPSVTKVTGVDAREIVVECNSFFTPVSTSVCVSSNNCHVDPPAERHVSFHSKSTVGCVYLPVAPSAGIQLVELRTGLTKTDESALESSSTANFAFTSVERLTGQGEKQQIGNRNAENPVALFCERT